MHYSNEKQSEGSKESTPQLKTKTNSTEEEKRAHSDHSLSNSEKNEEESEDSYKKIEDVATKLRLKTPHRIPKQSLLLQRKLEEIEISISATKRERDDAVEKH